METIAIIETHNYGAGLTLHYDPLVDVVNVMVLTPSMCKIVACEGVTLIGADYLELGQFFARNGLLLDVDEVQAICETFDDHIDKVVNSDS